MERATDKIEVRKLDGEKVDVYLYKYLNILETKKYLKQILPKAHIRGKEVDGEIDLGSAMFGVLEMLWADTNTIKIEEINISDLKDKIMEQLDFLIGTGDKRTD